MTSAVVRFHPSQSCGCLSSDLQALLIRHFSTDAHVSSRTPSRYCLAALSSHGFRHSPVVSSNNFVPCSPPTQRIRHKTLDPITRLRHFSICDEISDSLNRSSSGSRCLLDEDASFTLYLIAAQPAAEINVRCGFLHQAVSLIERNGVAPIRLSWNHVLDSHPLLSPRCWGFMCIWRSTSFYVDQSFGGFVVVFHRLHESCAQVVATTHNSFASKTALSDGSLPGAVSQCHRPPSPGNNDTSGITFHCGSTS